MQVTDGQSCQSAPSAPAIVTVNPLPIAAITPESATTFCAGGSVVLDAGAGFSGYRWSSGETTRKITVTQSGSYTVQVTDGQSAPGCTAQTSVTVVVYPGLTASVSGPTAIRFGQTATLTASGGDLYLWNTGDTGPTITVSPDKTATYSVTATDANGCSATASREITVEPLPIAEADHYVTSEDTALTIKSTEGLLSNDSDPGKSVLTAVLVSNPAHGLLSLGADGGFTYTPDRDFNGSDTFRYVAKAGGVQSGVAVVSLEITPVNDPPVANPDTASTAEDTTATVNIAANDTDVDGNLDVASVDLDPVVPGRQTSLSVAGKGSFAVDGSGNVTFIPALNFNGTVVIPYSICDKGTPVLCASSTLTVVVTPVNDSPIARDDIGVVGTRGSVVFRVLDNDSDPDGESLSVVAVTQPSHGFATKNADGTITYTASDACAQDSFGYTISDGNGGTATAIVRVQIIDAEAPVFPALKPIRRGNGLLSCEAILAIDVPLATDNCDPEPTVTGQRNDGRLLTDPFPVGVTTISWTARDAANNTSSITQTVEIADAEAPVIPVLADIHPTNDPNQCSATIVVSHPKAVDNCDPAPSVIGARSDHHPLSDPYPVGETVITWTAVDQAGNASQKTQKIVVSDAQPPVARCHDISVVLDASGHAAITPADIDNGSFDNCAIAELTLDRTQFDASDAGLTRTVTLTARDVHGNTASCPANVAVKSLASFTINDVQLLEGNSGTTDAVLTVTLSNPAGQAASVGWTTVDGTAVAPEDYFAASGVLNFAPGVTTQTITVKVRGDTTFEADETLFVNLSGAVNAAIGREQGRITILNDDREPILTVQDISVPEGNTGVTAASVTLSLSNPSRSNVSVNWATLDGTAKNFVDYLGDSGVITFEAGETVKEISVSILANDLNEPDKDFYITLDHPQNAKLARTQGTVTIRNDDAMPEIRIDNTIVTQRRAGTTNATFHVTLSRPSGQTIKVDFATQDGTAKGGVDFVKKSGTLTFAPSQAQIGVRESVSRTPELSVARSGSSLILAWPVTAENFVVEYSEALGEGGTWRALGGSVQQVASEYRVSDPYNGRARFYRLKGQDFTGVVFNPGDTDKTVDIPVSSNVRPGPTREFYVNLSNPVNAVIAQKQGRATILNTNAVPSISINDLAIEEGNTGTSDAILTVSLSTDSADPVTVNWRTADGSAIAPDDYLARSGTLIFPPGMVALTITNKMVGDRIRELDETFAVQLSGAVNATISKDQGVVLILNDDAAPTVSISDARVLEGNSGLSEVVQTVSLSSPSGQAIRVKWATGDGTAVAPDDYVAAAGTVTFPAGTTTQTVTNEIKGDLLIESDETFKVTLSAPVNATLAKADGIVTILNDDTPPTLAINDVAVLEGDAGTTKVVQTVTLSGPAAEIVTVAWATSDITAAAGSDYIAAKGTITFLPGIISQTITNLVNGDLLYELDETFSVILSLPANAVIKKGQGVVTIRNDDPLPKVFITGATVVEGDQGTTDAIFDVHVEGQSALPIQVDYATLDNTALTPADYLSTSGTLTFAPASGGPASASAAVPPLQIKQLKDAVVLSWTPGSQILVEEADSLNPTAWRLSEGQPGTGASQYSVAAPSFGRARFYRLASVAAASGSVTQHIHVPIVGDRISEDTETFFVRLSNAVGAVISVPQATGTIVDNDSVAVEINDVTVVEGNSGVTNVVQVVTLSNPSTKAVTVNWTTVDGTAIESADYISANGTVSFAPGVTTQFITNKVRGDLLNEADETFAVSLSSPFNAAISKGKGVVTIVNDDAAPAVSIDDVSVLEGNSGTVNAVQRLTLSAASGLPVTVKWGTVDGSAKAPADYLPASGVRTFSPGITVLTVTNRVVGDLLNEPDETFSVFLSSPENATLAKAEGVVKILNDDALPTMAIEDISIVEGDSGVRDAVQRVTLSAASERTVTVQWTTVDGTAKAPVDYVQASGILTFPAGVTSQTITNTVNGDTVYELDEVFVVALSSASNAGISKARGQITIQNDDPLPKIFISGATVVEGDSGTSDALFEVHVEGATALPISVDYGTFDNTAVAPGDYLSAKGTLTFTPNSEVSSATSTRSPALQIRHESSGPVLTWDSGASVRVEERDSLASAWRPVVNQPNGGSSQYLVPDAAAARSRFFRLMALAPGSGVTTQRIHVPIVGDLIAEDTETFFVRLANPVGAAFGVSEAIGTIVDNDQAAISISDVTVKEGNSGSTDAVMQVTLSTPSARAVSVKWATADGSAQAGSDYLQASGSITFAPGVVTQTITNKVIGDRINELDETFVVNLTAPVNATLARGQGVVTILNDDVVPALSISDVQVIEGNSGTTDAVQTIALSAASAQIVTVKWATADGTAAAPGDYVAGSGTVTFAPGTVSQTITNKIKGDLLNELDETFVVNLTAPVNATLARGQGVVTILNDDVVPALSISDVQVIEGNSGTTDAVQTIALSAASAQIVTVKWATADGTAAAPGDYVAGSGTVTFAPGTVSQTITNKIKGDLLNEPDETFVVNLTAPVNATVAKGQGVVTILNDDAVPVLSISDIQVIEGNSGTTDAVQTITLSAASAQIVTVKWATADGTAAAPGDYVAGSGTVTFAPGTVSQTITNKIKGDLLNELDETFAVQLSTPANASVAKAVGIVTILNDDGAPALTINDVSVAEGNAGTTLVVQTVSLSSASAQPIKVDWSTVNGTATAPADFVAANGTLVFAPGVVVQTITNRVNADLVYELDETFTVNLSGPVNTAIAKGQGVVTVLNDDAAPRISINDVSVTEGDSGTRDAVFVVTVDGPTSLPVTVSYATADSTAIAGSDYSATSGTLTFAPVAGTTTAAQEIHVSVMGDRLAEDNEKFVVHLLNPAGGSLLKGDGTGTIVDDDQCVISVDDVTVAEGDSGTTDALFTLKLSVANSRTVTAAFATADETATAGLDYTAASGTLTFNPGETVKTIAVKVIGDVIAEANETFLLKLASAVNATPARPAARATIIDNDQSVIRSSDIVVTEGDIGVSDALLTLTLSNPNSRPVSVSYATQDDSAQAGSDYVAATGSVTFAPGETSKNLAIKIVGDTIVEPTERFFVSFSAPVNGGLGTAQSVITIVDNDKPAVPPSIRLTSPNDGDTFSQGDSIAVAALVTQGSSPISSVEFFGDTASLGKVTVAPYQLFWDGAALGSHQIRAVVTDQANQTAESTTITIQVVVPDTRKRVAIVQNFADVEVSSLQAWLTDLDLSVKVFNQEGLTLAALQKYDLVIWDDLGSVSGGLTTNDVAIFNQLYGSGIPLYFIGNKLGASGAALAPDFARTWAALTHLNLAGASFPGDTHVSVQDSLHPVNNGPFGFVGAFSLRQSLENVLGTGTGEEVVAAADHANAVMAFEDPATTTRLVSQDFLAMNTGAVNATVQREKLFKNAVWWLLKLPAAPPFLNVSVDVADVPTSIKVGQDLTLTITVQHTGEIAATGVILTVALPANLSYVSATSGNNDIIAEGQNIIFLLPNLERVDNTTVTVTVHSTAVGTAEILGGVSENQAEAILDDNYFTTTLEVTK